MKIPVDMKTSIFGVITAAAGFVVFKPELFDAVPVVKGLAEYIMIGGLAAIGISAKDTNKGSDRTTEVVDEKLDKIPPVDQ